jgi:hypothetical protein
MSIVYIMTFRSLHPLYKFIMHPLYKGTCIGDLCKLFLTFPW